MLSITLIKYANDYNYKYSDFVAIFTSINALNIINVQISHLTTHCTVYIQIKQSSKLPLK